MTLLAFAATGRTAADVIDRWLCLVQTRDVQQSMDIACRGTWPNAGNTDGTSYSYRYIEPAAYYVSSVEDRPTGLSAERRSRFELRSSQSAPDDYTHTLSADADIR